MTDETKKSFILYHDYYEIIKKLPKEQIGDLLSAIFEYEMTGQTPKLDFATELVFIGIRQDLDRNAEKYEAYIEKQRENGKKGGRPRKDSVITENEDEKFLTENPTVFSKTQKSLNDNVNDNDNVNVNENVNDNLSLINKVSEEEREKLKNYVQKKKLATKSVTAYVNKIIENGDHISILENMNSPPKSYGKSEKSREDIISEELSSIHDKRSAAKILYRYHAMGSSPPSEFDEIMEKYDLDTYDKLYAYGQELSGTSS